MISDLKTLEDLRDDLLLAQAGALLHNMGKITRPFLISKTFAQKYLFSWNKIPGNDNERLIIFLNRHFDIEWVKSAEIEKINGGRAIKISTGKKSLSLTLYNENTKVCLKIDDGRTYEFIVKTENSKLNIYDPNINYKYHLFLLQSQNIFSNIFSNSF